MEVCALIFCQRRGDIRVESEHGIVAALRDETREGEKVRGVDVGSRPLPTTEPEVDGLAFSLCLRSIEVLETRHGYWPVLTGVALPAVPHHFQGWRLAGFTRAKETGSNACGSTFCRAVAVAPT